MSQLTHIVWEFFTIYFFYLKPNSLKQPEQIKNGSEKEDNLPPQKQLFMHREKTTQKTKKMELS